jgi:hypothetical protein
MGLGGDSGCVLRAPPPPPPHEHEGVSCSLQFPLCACARPTRLSGLCVLLPFSSVIETRNNKNQCAKFYVSFLRDFLDLCLVSSR